MRTFALLLGLSLFVVAPPAEAAICGVLGEPCCAVPAVAPTACETGLTCFSGVCESIASPIGARPVPAASAAGILATTLLLAAVGGGRLLRQRRRRA